MLGRKKDKPEPTQAPGQELLKDALYADTSSIITGGVLTVGAALVAWLSCGSATPLTVAALCTSTAFLRLYIASRRKKRWVNWFDTAFTSLTIFYLLCIGYFTYWAFNYSEDQFVSTITTFVVTINTMSIALRSFAVERNARFYMFALGTPVIAAFLVRGGIYYSAAVVQVLSAYYSYRSATRLRGILISEMTYRSRSETLAARFRFAIDNMSHGMCMIGPDMQIAVANAQLAEVLGLTGRASLQGVRFGALVRLARRFGAIDPAGAERLMSSFEATRQENGVASMELVGIDGRVADVTIKRNEEGGWVLVAQDVTEQRRAREALDHAARFDAMTGLPNRTAFETRLVECLQAAQGNCIRTELLFLDLDLFKQVNDTMGHKMGDRVLVESANRLRQAVGAENFAARWGGDEFVVLRQGGDDASAVACAERLIAELSRPIWIDGTEIKVGASAGVAVCGDGLTSMETLLQHADLALYTAKREARGSCRLFETAMNDKARERRLLELDIQSALAARSFDLRYQPIVDLETGELVSFEALAAWRHPTRGSVSPVVFIQVLEELNLMQVFGAWTLQRACEDAAHWPQPARVGVNVSGKQIDTLLEAVKRALAGSGLAPERLELEITETAALEGGDEARRVLEAVRALGVRIALDDFGTGFSSLSHLMSLPLDKVKIDKSFTQQMGLSRRADVVVANIARLSSQLGMRVTFEGVETEAQLDLVRAVGVPSEGQGWLFGRATDNAELGRFFGVEPMVQAVA